jgi:hypothetical protein
MPLSDRKIIDIIFEECHKIKERCPGYEKELKSVVADIIAAERQHRVQGTYIQQKVSERCNAAGHLLTSKRVNTKVAGEDS